MSENWWRGSGGLTSDPRIDFVGTSGVTKWSVTVATSGTRYDSATREQGVITTYVRASCIGYRADRYTEMNLKRGDEVLVEGPLSQYVPEGGDEKDRKTTVEIVRLEVLRRSRGKSASPEQGPPATESDGWATSDGEPPF